MKYCTNGTYQGEIIQMTSERTLNSSTLAIFQLSCPGKKNGGLYNM
jgi:hypothetical protein